MVLVWICYPFIQRIRIGILLEVMPPQTRNRIGCGNGFICISSIEIFLTG